jgi:hypothetical protein
MKKSLLLSLALLAAVVIPSFAEVTVDEQSFGTSLGGWNKRNTAEYDLSGASYRTYKPEVSPTPDGGLFISVRIDYVRGWLASNDHAVLEITVTPKGSIASAQSNIAIQGQSIKSDVILGANEAGKSILTPEGAVQVGTDLVANLSAKLMRENIVEAGRVSFPAVLRHNYNHLFQAIRVDGLQVLRDPVPIAKPVDAPATAAAPEPVAKTAATTAAPVPPPGPAAPAKPKEETSKNAVPLEIKPFH